MRITNSTHWRTDQIAALIRRVAQDELDAGQLRKARIEVRYKRSGTRVMGRCTVGTGLNPRIRMTLMLPRVGPVSVPDYALIVAHELAHAKGLHHRQMNKSSRYYWVEGWKERYTYAENFPIEAKPAKAVVKPTIDDKRRKAHDKALAMAAKWERRLKQASSMLKKWQRRARTVERRLSLAADAAHA